MPIPSNSYIFCVLIPRNLIYSVFPSPFLHFNRALKFILWVFESLFLKLTVFWLCIFVPVFHFGITQRKCLIWILWLCKENEIIGWNAEPPLNLNRIHHYYVSYSHTDSILLWGETVNTSRELKEQLSDSVNAKGCFSRRNVIKRNHRLNLTGVFIDEIT